MNDRIKKAFDQIDASEELKNRTREFLRYQTHRSQKPHRMRLRFAAAAACLLFVLLGGHWLYFTPTAKISIDINPSIELGVNRFDRVVSVDGYNPDGEALTEAMNLRFTDYEDAVGQILANESIASLLSEDAVMTIAVIGPDGVQTVRMLSDIKTCTAGQQNTYCYSAHREEVDAAHELGLSYGKYRAFLELQALDPTVTPEEIRHMSMRQIRDFLELLASDDAPAADTPPARVSPVPLQPEPAPEEAFPAEPAHEPEEPQHHGEGYGGGNGNGFRGEHGGGHREKGRHS